MVQVRDSVGRILQGNPVGHAVHRLRQVVRARHRRSVQVSEALTAIERLGPHLAPGPWVAVFRKAYGSKGEKLRYLAHESVDPRSLAAHSLRIGDPFAFRKASVTTVRTGVAPTFSTPVQGDVLLLRAKGTTALVLDLHRRKVLRLSDRGFPEEYRRVRDAFSRRVSSVPYEMYSGADGIVEPLLDGPSLRQVPVETAANRVCELLDQLPRLLAEATGDSSTQFLVSAIEASDPTSELARERDAILAWLGPSPLVPAHGDLHLFNVLDVGGGPVCIDFGLTSFQPAWRDVLKIANQFFVFFELPGCGPHVADVERALESALKATTASPLPSDWRRLSVLCARRTFGRRSVSEELLTKPSSWAS